MREVQLRPAVVTAVKTPGKAYESRISEKTLVTEPLCKPKSGTFLNQTWIQEKLENRKHVMSVVDREGILLGFRACIHWCKTWDNTMNNLMVPHSYMPQHWRSTCVVTRQMETNEFLQVRPNCPWDRRQDFTMTVLGEDKNIFTLAWKFEMRTVTKCMHSFIAF